MRSQEDSRFKSTQLKGLINRLTARGDPIAATAITSAVYPGRDSQPPQQPALGKTALIDLVEGFRQGRTTEAALFERAFGRSKADVLGYGETIPDEAPQPKAHRAREGVAYEGEMALYNGKCQSCGATDRPVYPGWKMMDLGLWACEPCIRDRSGDSQPALDLIERFKEGEIDIVLAREWKRLTDLHAET